jgi:hypothetical protein
MRTFGVEIEYVNMDRRVVANKVAEALGVQHIHVLPYHGTICETCQSRVLGYTEWKVERDGSVSSGGEVISPILQGEDGFVQIKKVMKAIKEAGGSVSTSCGLHVHLGVRDMTTGMVKNIKRSDTREIKTGGTLMPDGLTATLSPQQLADLIRYLSELGK